MRKFTILSLLMLCISGVFAAQDIYISTTGDDSNSGTQESPYASLAKATSMVSEDGAVIHVASGTYVFSSTAVIKPYNQTITGDDAANTIFDGNNTVSLIDGITEMQTSGKKLELQKIKFQNGYLGAGSILGGAAIRMGTQTDLDVSDCYFVNNNAVTGIQTWGGAIYFNGNTLLVKRCFFEDNTSMSTNNEDTSRQGYGGAITVRHSLLGATDATIKNSTFYNNIGNTKGGAVYFNKMLATNDDATFVVQNCVFLDNKSVHGGPVAKLGAAIALSSGANTNNKMSTIILTNNTICNNNMIDAIGNPLQKNAILLEGSRYVSYMANNIITSSYMTAGEGLFANLPAPVEYGKNNIIDEINVNINGTDFTTNGAALNNSVVTVRPDALKVSTTLTGYPLGTVFNVPYLTVNSGSLTIDGGVNSYTVNTVANPAPADPVEFVEKSDIRGLEFATIRDLGAWEYDEETANRSDIVYTTAISLFTDPVTNTLSVITDVDIVSIALFDGTGRFVCQKTNQKTLYTDKLFRGVYVIQIDDIEGNTYRLKFIKK